MADSKARWVLTGFMALVALCAAAVLDLGSPTAEAAPSVSPFAGSWSGTWAGNNGFDGTMSLTVSDAGQLSGRITHTQLGDSGAIHGHISDNGLVSMVAFAPSDDPNVNGSGVPLSGSAGIDDGGTLLVSLRAPVTGSLFVVILVRS